MKKDTQDEKPKVAEELKKVGVTDLRTLVQTKWQGKNYKFVPTIQLTIDLSSQKKGAHMSRLVESITESIEEEAEVVYSSLEKLGEKILERLAEKHPYTRGEIIFETELVVQKQTPATKKKTMEAHDVVVSVKKKNGSYSKKLKVSVVGNTVCPHSMENTGGKPHIQRAVAELILESDINTKIPLESLITICDESFSAPAYTLLKTPDENKVVERMHANPKFVEDVAREILHKTKNKNPNAKTHVKVVSHESIHRHNVIAEGSN